MFDFAKLRGRIIEKYESVEKFAASMGITSTTLGRKLSNKTTFKQDEIVKACELLDIRFGEIPEYFFTVKVKKSSPAA